MLEPRAATARGEGRGASDHFEAGRLPAKKSRVDLEGGGGAGCRVDETPAAYQTVCPIDASTWTSRFEAMNGLWVAMNGNTDLSPVSFGVAQLQPSASAYL